MNRVNKFRGYDKVNKRMFEVYGLGVDWCTENTDDGVNDGGNCWNGHNFKNNIAIMQFTGLTDGNEFDIYEGDILKCFINDKEIGNLDKVEYKNGAFILGYRTVSLLEWMTMPNDEYGSGLEVIGNIYQNYDLLK